MWEVRTAVGKFESIVQFALGLTMQGGGQGDRRVEGPIKTRVRSNSAFILLEGTSKPEGSKESLNNRIIVKPSLGKPGKGSPNDRERRSKEQEGLGVQVRQELVLGARKT